MGMEIKKEDSEIWTISIREKLAFKSYEDMMEILTTIMSIKKDHGNFKQLRKESAAIEDDKIFNKFVSMTDKLKNFNIEVK